MEFRILRVLTLCTLTAHYLRSKWFLAIIRRVAFLTKIVHFLSVFHNSSCNHWMVSCGLLDHDLVLGGVVLLTVVLTRFHPFILIVYVCICWCLIGVLVAATS